MKSMNLTSVPPPVLDGARVLKYAVLDGSVKFSGRTLLFVDGKELGPAPCLAICENLDDRDILLFHCQRDWEVLGAAGYASVGEAEKRAETTYPGVSRHWIDPHFTDEQVSNYLLELAAGERCTFCGRGAGEATLLEKNSKWICDGCTEEFHGMLQEK